MLQDLSKTFFGEPNKIVDRALVEDWVRRCGSELRPASSSPVDKGNALKDFVLQRAQTVRPSAASSTNVGPSDLVVAFDRMQSAGCQTLGQMAASIGFARRLALNFDHDPSTNGVNKWLKAMAAVGNQDKIGNLYDAANALNEIWLASEKSMAAIAAGTSTISAEKAVIDRSGSAARLMTELARCANDVELKRPNVVLDPKTNLNLLITDPQEIKQIPPLAAGVARDLGEKLFGLPRTGSMVNIDAIARWIAEAPANEIGSQGDIGVKANNLMKYVDKTARSLHGVNTPGLNEVLSNAYSLMTARKCDTVVQASDVLEYADTFTSYKKRFPKGRRDVLDAFKSAMDGDPSLKDTSQYRFVRELQRIEESAGGSLGGQSTILSVLDDLKGKKTTLDRAEDTARVGPGPEEKEKIEI
jgi:hypothetical protein